MEILDDCNVISLENCIPLSKIGIMHKSGEVIELDVPKDAHFVKFVEIEGKYQLEKVS